MKPSPEPAEGSEAEDGEIPERGQRVVGLTTEVLDASDGHADGIISSVQTLANPRGSIRLSVHTFSYTEVALNKSTIRAGIGTLLISLALSAGCQQEILSSNPRSRADGIKEFQEGNYADAAGSFRGALRSDPRDYKSQFYLAQCYEKMGQTQQAIQAYKASLDAQKLTYAGKEDQAQKLTTIDALAQCIAKSDNRDAELDIVEKQAKASSKSQDFLLLAKVYQYRGDADMALDAYNRGAINDPKDFILMKEYGLYLEQTGQKPQAAKALRKAYTLKQDDQQVNAALYRLNIIPGPGLKDEAQLTKPPVPVGPLPELSNFRLGSEPEAQPQQQAPVVPPATPPQAQTPRD